MENGLANAVYDGFSSYQLFNQGVCYTYDDVIFHPGHIFFAANEVDLTCNLTKNIRLRVPIVSSPMDTVTEAEMAITMASLGGMGFVHYNNTDAEQLRQVQKVKSHTPGFIVTPAVLGPADPVSKLYELKKYRGMGSLDAMAKGSESRYHSDTQSLKIAQGVSGAVKDKGSVRKTVPFLAQAVKQGFQDLGADSITMAREILYNGNMRMEARTNAAQAEGNVHDMVAFEKRPW
ncbi:Inosine-5'-monophosphate dehydrogenase [Tetrabaena socialis]|uniref:Inosine-5'-monophosphate dehydrogenase n=1 Tax=Tetrabaena socialis TaxID=47790 RepID=A0A2J7ZWU9_9CHLO|nr:Inosine-5'-monophosphate dehydrogenase [Tetrabaena socialis]|eukprot:PNH04750.1 Inosine-5'-monophosphate dehydrogenase [Tetrabaena socialis]